MNREKRGEPDLPPGPARDLVDLFRRLRHARPLSGGQIAVKTGLSASHVSDVLRGWKAPSPGAAARIAAALGASQEAVRQASRLADELADLNRYNRRRARAGEPPAPGADQTVTGPVRRPAGGERVAAPAPEPATLAAPPGRRPRVLDHGEIRRYEITGLTAQPARHLGIVTGDLRRVRCAEVWVNSENTEMLMARHNEFSVSSIVRYEAARRDEAGRVVDDPIADELTRKVAHRRPVAPGTAIVTGPGELARCLVRFVVHVAAVQGEPGAGYRQVREIGRCVTSALAAVDRLDARPPVRTVLFPLLGTGQGGGDLPSTVSALAGAAIDHFTWTPATEIRTVFFLAYTDVELEACEAALAASGRLRPVAR